MATLAYSSGVTLAEVLAHRRPAASGPLADTAILGRAVATVPVRPMVLPPADESRRGLVGRIVARWHAARDRTPGRHRRHGGPVRSHRAGGGSR